MANIALNHSQKEFRNQYRLRNLYFAISRQKDSTVYLVPWYL